MTGETFKTNSIYMNIFIFKIKNSTKNFEDRVSSFREMDEIKDLILVRPNVYYINIFNLL